MNKLVFSQQAKFRHLSQEAASLERQGKYHAAAKAWSKARDAALNTQNQEWCICRSNFCDRMAERPFKGEK